MTDADESVTFAWDWAANYAANNKLFDIPMNRNGYPVDGVKPITPMEKLDMLQKLADHYLANHEDDQQGIVLPSGHAFGNPSDVLFAWSEIRDYLVNHKITSLGTQTRIVNDWLT